MANTENIGVGREVVAMASLGCMGLVSDSLSFHCTQND